MPGRRRFEVFDNPLRILEADVTRAGMKFYRLGEVPKGSTPIWLYQTPESLFEVAPNSNMSLREECDATIGEGCWAVTPSARKDGEPIDGLIDIVTAVKSSESSRPTSQRTIKQALARPALRVVRYTSESGDQLS